MENWVENLVVVGIGGVFIRLIIPWVVQYIDKKNEKHKEEMKALMKDYEARLDAKDERLNTVIDQFGNSLHEMSEAMEKQTNMVVGMREEFRPLKDAAPLIDKIVEKIEILTKAS